MVTLVTFIVIVVTLIVVIYKKGGGTSMVEDRCRICGTYGPVCEMCWRCDGCGCRPWCNGGDDKPRVNE